MALTYSSYASFKEVEAAYNTTPLRGSDNAGKDIRPIGDRKRKWERIVKVSPNCYALSDGYHFGDEIFGTYYHSDVYGAARTTTLKHMEQYAPIVWRKKRDGTEEVTLRNGWGVHSHNGRYQFLYRHTPKGMWFRNRNGKHFIQNGSTDPYTAHYIAKVRTAPKPVYDSIMKNPSTHYWQKRQKAWVRAQDDNSAVTFRKNEHGGWDHVEGTGRDLEEVKGPTVKKAEKAKYKDAIKSFFEWGMAMSPLLPLGDTDYRQARSGEITKHFANQYRWNLRPLEKTKSRAIVCDDEHPLRVSLWVDFAASCTYSDSGWSFDRTFLVQTVETKEDLARVRTLYNRWINKNLGFMTKKLGSE
jgi:hypothetical protein